MFIVLKGHFFISSGELLLVFLPLRVAPPRLEEQKGTVDRCRRRGCGQGGSAAAAGGSSAHSVKPHGRKAVSGGHFQNKSLKMCDAVDLQNKI